MFFLPFSSPSLLVPPFYAIAENTVVFFGIVVRCTALRLRTDFVGGVLWDAYCVSSQVLNIIDFEMKTNFVVDQSGVKKESFEYYSVSNQLHYSTVSVTIVIFLYLL